MAYLQGEHKSLEAHQIDTILWDYCQRFQTLPPSEGEETAALGVYSIEGDWKSPEVMPSATILQGWTQVRGASLTLESAATRDELLDYLRMWSEAEASYGILYLRFPRWEGNGLLLNASGGAGAGVGIEEIASCVEKAEYSNENCILHLGPCWPKLATTEEMERLVERTGFAAISGYANEVGWVESLAFDLLYLERLAEAAHSGLLTPQAAADCRDLLAGASYGALSRSLGFRLVAAA